MSNGLQTGIDESPTFAATIALPYTLTLGRAAGTYLTELAQRRIIGSRCERTGAVTVPPADYCPCGQCGPTGFVTVADTGTVTAWTRTPSGTVAMIRLEGAETELLHRIVGDDSRLANGAQVKAVWGQPEAGFLALSGFELTTGELQANGPESLEPSAEAAKEMPYSMELHYQHSYGPYYGRMFDELATGRRILGTKCPRCLNVLIPARGNCDVCFVGTTQVVDVADTGTLLAFSVINLEFVGQTRKPPYVYAEINLDGSATRLIHNVGGFDMADANRILRVGMKVRAVWREDAPAQGTLADIDYFAPIEGD